MKEKKKKPHALWVDEDVVTMDTATEAPSEQPLSEEEIALFAAATKKAQAARGELPPLDNSEMAQTIRYAKKNKIFSVAAVVAVISAAAVLISAVALAIKGISDYIRTHADYTIQIEDKMEYTVDYKTVMRDQVLYIDLMSLCDAMELTVSGSATSKKFTAPGKTHLRFEDGKTTAEVNGYAVHLGGTASVSGEHCYIPMSFLSNAIQRGFVIRLDEDAHIITVRRQYYRTTGQKVELLFDETALSSAEEILFDYVEKPNYLPFTYPLDVSAYLEQMYAKQLILVNKTTEPLTEKDKPDDLVKLSDMDGCAVANDGTAYYLRSDAAYALAAMMQAMVLQEPDAQGTVVTSAYRGYAYQESLFERYIANEAKKYPNATREELEAIVAEYSAPPGTSEHQTGLCFDFTCPEVGGDVVEEFEDTAAFAWLAANAYKYGFILRYPKDKVDITGYQYEPWHYRFVGVEAATEMHRTGLSLEEYLATPEA